MPGLAARPPPPCTLPLPSTATPDERVCLWRPRRVVNGLAASCVVAAPLPTDGVGEQLPARSARRSSRWDNDEMRRLDMAPSHPPTPSHANASSSGTSDGSPAVMAAACCVRHCGGIHLARAKSGESSHRRAPRSSAVGAGWPSSPANAPQHLPNSTHSDAWTSGSHGSWRDSTAWPMRAETASRECSTDASGGTS